MNWQPIETAPKDGRYLMVGNEDGVWVACYTPTFQSGFQPDNPWISLMLNHRHIEKVKRNYSSVPTHWMPLPQAPKVGCGETATPNVKVSGDAPPFGAASDSTAGLGSTGGQE